MASCGSTSDNSNNSSVEVKYKGVRKRKWGKWVSEIRLPNSRDRIWLGSFDSPQKAARAFDGALYCLRGSRATFNFPDTPLLFHLPPSHPQSLTHHDIQLLATAFANQPPPPPPPPPPNQQQTTPSLPHVDMDWSFLECWNNSEESSPLSHCEYDYAYDFDPTLLLDYVDHNAHPTLDNHHDQSLMLWSFQYD